MVISHKSRFAHYITIRVITFTADEGLASNEPLACNPTQC
jgi:hypothetical protein